MTKKIKTKRISGFSTRRNTERVRIQSSSATEDQKPILHYIQQKLSKNRTAALLLTVATLTTAIGSFSSGIESIASVFTSISETVNPHAEQYAQLEQLSLGMSREYLDQTFGPPIVRQSFSLQKGLSESIYVKPNFFLYTLSNTQGGTVYLALTSRKKDFNPPLGPLSKTNAPGAHGLGFFDLAALLPPDDPEDVYINCSSKFCEYREYIYMGSLGNYRDYMFGYNPAGFEMPEKKAVQLYKLQIALPEFYDYKIPTDDPRYLEFRHGMKPNSYGIIDNNEIRSDIKRMLPPGVPFGYSSAL